MKTQPGTAVCLLAAFALSSCCGSGCGKGGEQAMATNETARSKTENDSHQNPAGDESLKRDSERSIAARDRMVKSQLADRDITCPRVLEAMQTVPRHLFVPEEHRHLAYEDHPLPIAENQTISQPYIVAFMTQAAGIRAGETVLEIGTGSGYGAAVLAAMGARVFSIEIIPALGRQAEQVLHRLGYSVNVVIADGYDGLPEHAPFDAILVTAAPPEIPQPLIDQLKEGGRMVIPVGDQRQNLEVYHRRGGKLVLYESLPVRFVPMTGKARKNEP